MQTCDSIHRENESKQELEDEIIGNLFVGIMEGYTDSVIPPLSEFPPQAQVLRHGQTYCINNEKGGGSSSSKINPRKRASSSLLHHHHHHEGSLERERSRRGKMAEMYSVLQSIIFPNCVSKITREAIVSSTIEHIQRLEKEVAGLEDLKMKKNASTALPETMEAKPIISRCTDRSSSVEVSVYGGLTFFGVQLPSRRGSVAEMFKVFEKHQAEVLAANVAAAVDRRQLTATVTAVIGGNRVGGTIEKIKREILIL